MVNKLTVLIHKKGQLNIHNGNLAQAKWRKWMSDVQYVQVSIGYVVHYLRCF